MTELPTDPPGELDTDVETVDEMLADYKQLKEAKALQRQHEDKKQKKKEKVKKNRMPLLLTLLPVFFVLTIWNVARLTKAPEMVTIQDERMAAEWSIYMIIDGVETFRESTGHLPVSIEAIGLDDESVTYNVLGKIYSLTTTVGDREITYHDGDDVEPFMESYDALMAGSIQ
jgi:hypothetical protein